ncbi:hypothetical protein [Williamsia sp.]|uniref:hypothetical protein n=1 Tax=Williamsia sp. TaxID=1872085 RepID=UPI001A1DDF27|nr:hypothetical protein [Williamsia sp.]MBJ7291709.1 hypothetical protein [Williamsia sp.]
MRRSSAAALCASLMVTGGALAVTPAVASAGALPGVFEFNASVVDPTGVLNPPGTDESRYGNKVTVSFKVYRQTRGVVGYRFKAPVKCLLETTNQETGASVSSRVTMKAQYSNTVFGGSKTTAALSPGDYTVTARCDDDGFVTSKDASVTIVNAPPAVISGTARCYSQAKQRSVRPVGLELIRYGQTYKVRLRGATSGDQKASTSTFSYDSYSSGPYSARLICSGSASNPRDVVEFDGPFSAPSTIALVPN